MSDSNKDDWEMTRANFQLPKEDEFSPEEDVFARNAPPKKNDWTMTRNEPKYDAYDKTTPNFSLPQNNEWNVTPKSQANNDWDKTQANIHIPSNNAPKPNNDDWGMTQANIQIPPPNAIQNFDQTMYGFSPQNPEFEKTKANFNISPAAKGQTFLSEATPQKAEQTASTNDATKWIYFLAGAFSMFVFMVIFLGVIYLLFLFK